MLPSAVVAWARRLRPPVFEDEDVTHGARILHPLFLAMLAVTAFLTAAAPVANPSDPRPFWVTGLVLAPAWIGGLAAVRRGRVRAAAIGYVVGFGALVTVGLFVLGAMSFVVLNYFVIIIVTQLTLGNRAGMGAAVACVVVTLVAALAEERGLWAPIGVGRTPLSAWLTFATNATAASVLLYVANASIRDGIERARRGERELRSTNWQLQEVAAKRRQLIEELEARNSELERFTYTVSHDLKNPLITVRGFAGQLLRLHEQGATRQLAEDVSRIEAAASRMNRLLDELLELSRIGRIANPPTEVPLRALAEEALGSLASRLEEARVEARCAADLPTVRADRERLLEVLVNLVDNAIRHRGDTPAPTVEIGTRRDGAQRVVFVRDNGQGIAPQFHEKVFGLFERLDPQVPGTGVGLALARRIIEVHGGRLWVESDGAGRGSCFCFTLGESDGDGADAAPRP